MTPLVLSQISGECPNSILSVNQNCLWLAGAAAAILAFTMQIELQIAGLALSSCILIAIIWINVVRPRLRQRQMKTPFTAYFRTGGNEKLTELHVPANRSIDIQINREPHLHYTEYELIFGFKGPLDKRPYAQTAKNLFIKRGQFKEGSPDTDDRHYIDTKDAYHITQQRKLTKGNTFTIGFTVQTREPGRYPVRLRAITEAGEGRPRKELVLIVDEK